MTQDPDIVRKAYEARENAAMIEVSRYDLRAVTSAVLDYWIEQYTCGSGREVTICRFCNHEQVYQFKNYCVPNPDHALDCPL